MTRERRKGFECAGMIAIAICCLGLTLDKFGVLSGNPAHARGVSGAVTTRIVFVSGDSYAVFGHLGEDIYVRDVVTTAHFGATSTISTIINGLGNHARVEKMPDFLVCVNQDPTKDGPVSYEGFVRDICGNTIGPMNEQCENACADIPGECLD